MKIARIAGEIRRLGRQEQFFQEIPTIMHYVRKKARKKEIEIRRAQEQLNYLEEVRRKLRERKLGKEEYRKARRFIEQFKSRFGMEHINDFLYKSASASIYRIKENAKKIGRELAEYQINYLNGAIEKIIERKLTQQEYLEALFFLKANKLAKEKNIQFAARSILMHYKPNPELLKYCLNKELIGEDALITIIQEQKPSLETLRHYFEKRLISPAQAWKILYGGKKPARAETEEQKQKQAFYKKLFRTEIKPEETIKRNQLEAILEKEAQRQRKKEAKLPRKKKKKLKKEREKRKEW